MDAAGVDPVVVSEHGVFGENLSVDTDPSLVIRRATGPAGRWLEPLTLLAAIAAMTTRIRLSTAVLLAALRRPPS